MQQAHKLPTKNNSNQLSDMETIAASDVKYCVFIYNR